MDTQSVLQSLENGVLTIRLNRPEKKNALSTQMYDALEAILLSAAEDPEVRVAVICGSPGAFCGGNDMPSFLGMSKENTQDIPPLRMMRAVRNFPKALIAAINGVTVGVGVTLLPHCDLVYASEDSRFILPFVNLGICPEFASTYVMPQIMGHQKAAELLFFGDPFDAQTARECQLVTAVMDSDAVEQHAQAQAAKLAAKAPNALRTTKLLMRRWQDEKVNEVMSHEIERLLELLHQGEAKQAITAFIEKRKPDFSAFK